VSDASLAEVLRARGLRLTAQRQLVLEAVYQLGHATPEQVHHAVTEVAAGVNITTIYRTLELLEELELVKHAHLGHGAPAYRPADDDHIHVVCHVCGSVIDAPDDLVDALVERLHDENGFTLDRSHFTVFGRCASCLAGEQKPAAQRSIHHHDH
jgi:Fur family transcriptional regulator, ferric uptake regulator